MEIFDFENADPILGKSNDPRVNQAILRLMPEQGVIARVLEKSRFGCFVDLTFTPALHDAILGADAHLSLMATKHIAEKVSREIFQAYNNDSFLPLKYEP